ncbi:MULTISPECIES: hypothetical protein [unclassified Arcicella]|uniref:hypothetical protein n=1 Tax=unclassified Arcicella TaxID=2644986 RepID=UPI00285E928F|nr:MULTISPECIES: hypothetical protein [unclassified Arcicella]MDR6561156.1 hypothetical protein [Arcicella sp. BE51]MDR6811040.1 hypothetical protein [Arcicella sp. BE140]MDR6822390.1 hypothetical protein [Arcicella sp. BE139]
MLSIKKKTGNSVRFYEAKTNPLKLEDGQVLFIQVSYVIILLREDETFQLILVYKSIISAILPFLLPLDDSLTLFQSKTSDVMNELIKNELQIENDFLMEFRLEQIKKYDWLLKNDSLLEEICTKIQSGKFRNIIKQYRRIHPFILKEQ